MGPGRRLREFRKFMNLSQKEFAELIGRKGATLQKYETDSRNIEPAALIALNAKFGLNIDWINTGVGEMVSTEIKKRIFRIPVFADLTGTGCAAEFVEYGIDYANSLSPYPESIYLYRSQNDYCAPLFMKGDIIAVSRKYERADGVFVYKREGLADIRQLCFLSDKIAVLNAPASALTKISVFKIDEIELIGRVIFFSRTL